MTTFEFHHLNVPQLLKTLAVDIQIIYKFYLIYFVLMILLL